MELSKEMDRNSRADTSVVESSVIVAVPRILRARSLFWIPFVAVTTILAACNSSKVTTSSEESPEDASQMSQDHDGSASLDEPENSGASSQPAKHIVVSVERVDEFLGALLAASDCSPVIQVGSVKTIDSLYPVLFPRYEEMQKKSTAHERIDVFCGMCSELGALDSYLPPLEYRVSAEDVSRKDLYNSLGDSEAEEAGETGQAIGVSSVPVTWHKYRYLKVGLDGTSVLAFKIDVPHFLDDHPDLNK